MVDKGFISRSTVQGFVDEIRRLTATDGTMIPAEALALLATVENGVPVPEWMTALEFATVTFSAADQTVINIPCTLGAQPSGLLILSPVNATPADNYYYWKYISYPIAIGYTLRGIIGAYSPNEMASVDQVNGFCANYVSYADNMLSIDLSSWYERYSYYCFEENTPYYCIMWV